MYSVQEIKKTGRTKRFPKHPYQIKQRPHIIQPICIAPVLPGETLQNISFQSRAVTDPIKNPLVGWYNETMFFYVKLSDMYDRDVIRAALLDNTSLSSLDSATAVDRYHENTSSGVDVDWQKLALERIVDVYFRSQDDDFTIGTLTGSGGTTSMPIARVVPHMYTDSLINNAAYQTASDVELLDISAGTTIEGSDDKLMASEVENQLRKYQLAKMANLTELTWEEYQAQYYGGTVQEEPLYEPELLCHFREWQYPSNTVDPTNGTPRSAVSWVCQGSEKRNFFFKECGFIIGVNIVRPKNYFKNLSASATILMKDSLTWLAPMMSDDPYASMVKIAAGDAPTTNQTDAVWLDMKDLFLYGDQYVNFASSVTDANFYDLPTAAGGQYYPATADVDGLFISASPANKVWTDGVVNLTILGRQSDTSPMQMGNNDTV